ncbi:MAG: PDZ domain-containing protein [Candidatus Obscuribacterales bacterium]|nr:PDZ domain-containing protein [Candidatus Obscuribacterales bacterium]
MLKHGLKIIASTLVLALSLTAIPARAAETSKYQDAFNQICRDVAARHPDGARLNCQKLSEQFAGKLNSADAVRSALRSAFASSRLRGYEVLSAPAAVAHELKVTSSEIGIGVSLRETDLVSRGLQVTNVMDDSTAQAAGLRKGDIIIAVDGKSLRDKTGYEATVMLQGTPGSLAMLELYRDGVAHTIQVQRDIDEKLGIEVLPLVRRAFEVPSLGETGPAAEAGLREKDIIVEIDRVSTDGKDNAAAYKMLANGAEGSVVELRILRDGNYQTLHVTRKPLQDMMKTIWDFRGQMGGSDDWYRISFRHLDWRGLPELMDDFTEELNKHQDLILDLRGANGNDAEVAAQFGARFMTDGFVLSTVDGGGVQTVYVMEGGKLQRKQSGGVADSTTEVAISGKRFEKRLTVLTDSKTAGTAEALAIALQKSGRARVIGHSSSGDTSINAAYKVVLDGSPVTVIADAGRVTDAAGAVLSPVQPDVKSWSSGEIVDQALAEIRNDGLWMSQRVVFFSAAGIAVFLSGAFLLFVHFFPPKSKSDESSEDEAAEAGEDDAEAPAKDSAEDNAKNDTGKSKLSAGRLIGALLAIIFVPLLLLSGASWLVRDTTERTAMRGEIVVKAFVDGSDLSKMQAGIIDEISKQYEGSISFNVVDVSQNPEAAGEVKNFPTVEIGVFWYNADGKNVSSQRSWRHAMPKREIHQYLEMYKKSSGSKKEIPITRIPR